MTLTYTPSYTLPSCGPTIPAVISFEAMGGASVSVPALPSIRQLLGPALAGMHSAGGVAVPLVPVLRLIDAVKSIGDLVANLPGSLAGGIINDVANVATAIAAVFALAVPAFALTSMVRGFILVYRNFLVALKAEVTSLVSRYTNVNSLIDQATTLGIASMLANAQCARSNLNSRVSAINASVSAAGAAIAVFSYLCCLLGFGHLGAVPVLDANALSAAVFDPPIAALDALLILIPPFGGAALNC